VNLQCALKILTTHQVHLHVVFTLHNIIKLSLMMQVATSLDYTYLHKQMSTE